MPLRPISMGWLVLAVTLGLWSPARGEILILKNGGRVIGQIVDGPDAKDAVTVKTPSGAQVTLPKSEIEEWIHQRPAEVEYEQIRGHYADTVEGQWTLAEWCREHALGSLREKHLRRVIELEPNHQKARAGLGYTQINGQWTTRDEVMLKQGMEKHKGRWRLPQEIALEREKHNAEVVERDWKQKLNRWRGWLGTSRDRLARESILGIRDTAAIKPLGAAILEETDRPAVRRLCVAALAGIGNDDAKMRLAYFAVEDPEEEVRLTCLDFLKKESNPPIVAYFISRLRDADSDKINRAAIGLRDMGDRSAIGPLIGALITTQKQKIRGSNPGQISTGFGSQGGGMSVGGGGPKIVYYQVHHREVLDALVALAGGPNFAFNVDQWKAWHATQKRTQVFDARRD